MTKMKEPPAEYLERDQVEQALVVRRRHPDTTLVTAQ